MRRNKTIAKNKEDERKRKKKFKQISLQRNTSTLRHRNKRSKINKRLRT